MRELLIDILKEEVKPAMGCTEPIAVALAAAKAREISNLEDFDKLDIRVSPNIYKNGLAVGIPHTNYVGLDIAALVGFFQGKSKYGLSVLQDVDENKLPDLHKLLDEKDIDLEILDTKKTIKIEVEMQGKTNIKVIIEDKHDNITYISKDNEILKNKVKNNKESKDKEDRFKKFYDLEVYEIIKEVEKMKFSDIKFMLDGYQMNKEMALEGLKTKHGVGLGYNSKKLKDEKIFSDDLSTYAATLTSAASDARMAGVNKSVMSSNGSGNNGLTAILPIVAFAERNEVTQEEIAKAIAISHLINSYIKNEIGRLSAMCSCSVSAGSSASAALVWLMEGKREAIEGTIKNMIANISGMICDGAKGSCAIKLFTSANLAVQSAYLSKKGSIVPHRNGIINKSVEKTIRNLGKLSKASMKLNDSIILDIMINND